MASANCSSRCAVISENLSFSAPRTVMLINIGPGNATRLNSIPSCSTLPSLTITSHSLLACTFDFSLSYFNFQLPIPLPVKNQFDSKLCSVISFLFSIRWQRVIPALSLSFTLPLLCSALNSCLLYRAVFGYKTFCRCERCTVRCMWSRPQQALHVTFWIFINHFM